MQPTDAASVDPSRNREPLCRHTLVWIEPRERERVWAIAPDDVRRDTLDQWFTNDWPMIVRRPDVVMPPGRIALGVPLPPREAKRRLSFDVPRNAIERYTLPPLLGDAARRLPRAWCMALNALNGEGRALGVTLRVFGSVAWQALTGLDYLTDESDVDLWWRPANLAELDAMLAAITRWQRGYGLRADGEIQFPDGMAVAWREWSTSRSNDRVLAKRIDSLELLSRDALVATFAARTARRAA